MKTNGEEAVVVGKAKQTSSSDAPKPVRRALTPEARENQLIAYAYDLVEERLRNGTASSQETTHFLKMGSSKAMLEREKLIAENKLANAKAEEIASRERSEELFREAIKAFGIYSGKGNPDDRDEPDDDY
jgi:hypothetical protein